MFIWMKFVTTNDEYCIVMMEQKLLPNSSRASLQRQCFQFPTHGLDHRMCTAMLLLALWMHPVVQPSSAPSLPVLHWNRLLLEGCVWCGSTPHFLKKSGTDTHIIIVRPGLTIVVDPKFTVITPPHSPHQSRPKKDRPPHRCFQCVNVGQDIWKVLSWDV